MGGTWVYDCAARTWEQRFPEVFPEASAAHVLAWLPKAKKIVKVGGYSKNRYLPFEIWTYDTGANSWVLHASVVPNKGYRGKASWKGLNVPVGYGNLGVIGAVNNEDVMILVKNYRGSRQTWALKIDTGAILPQENIEKLHTSIREVYGLTNRAPADFEKGAKIEPDKMKMFFENIPVNTWVKMPTPPKSVRNRDYGTTRYDPDRKQFLLWGGGHVNYWGTEVNHYSLRSGSWTAGEVPDEPLEPCFGMCLKVGMSFRNRPHIHCHAYQHYDYDYTTGLMLVSKRGNTYAYDVHERRWLWPLIEGSVAGVRATPKGTIGARNGSLVRFDKEQWKWIPYPCKSELKPLGVNIDYSGFCYDEKRDAVWYFNKKGVYRFDIKKEITEKVASKIGVKGYLREMLYIPELDRIMFHNRNKPDYDKHVFWNPEILVWEETHIPLVGTDGKTKPAKGAQFSTGQALIRDHYTGMIYVAGAGRSNYALRLDPEKLEFKKVE
jgi:hypothetical protein